LVDGGDASLEIGPKEEPDLVRGKRAPYEEVCDEKKAIKFMAVSLKI